MSNMQQQTSWNIGNTFVPSSHQTPRKETSQETPQKQQTPSKGTQFNIKSSSFKPQHKTTPPPAATTSTFNISSEPFRPAAHKPSSETPQGTTPQERPAISTTPVKSPSVTPPPIQPNFTRPDEPSAAPLLSLSESDISDADSAVASSTSSICDDVTIVAKKSDDAIEQTGAEEKDAEKAETEEEKEEEKRKVIKYTKEEILELKKDAFPYPPRDVYVLVKRFFPNVKIEASPHDKTKFYVQQVLNKIVPENCDKLMKELSVIDVDTLEFLQDLVKIIFSKAVSEHGRVEMYAKICKYLSENLNLGNMIDTAPSPTIGPSPAPSVSPESSSSISTGMSSSSNVGIGSSSSNAGIGNSSSNAGAGDEDKAKLFKKALLRVCHSEIMMKQEWKKFEEKPPEGLSKSEEDSYMNRRFASYNNFKGGVILIGELFNIGMISSRPVTDIIQSLLANTERPVLEYIEPLKIIFSKAGKKLSKLKVAKDKLPEYLAKINAMAELPEDILPPRYRFLLQDILDLSKLGWAADTQPQPVPVPASSPSPKARSPAVSPGPKGPKGINIPALLDKYRKLVHNTVEEFFEIFDPAEVLECVKEDIKEQRDREAFLPLAFEWALSNGKTQESQYPRLIDALKRGLDEGVFTRENFRYGIKSLLRHVLTEDFVSDLSPLFTKVVGVLCSRLVEWGVVRTDEMLEEISCFSKTAAKRTHGNKIAKAFCVEVRSKVKGVNLHAELKKLSYLSFVINQGKGNNKDKTIRQFLDSLEQ